MMDHKGSQRNEGKGGTFKLEKSSASAVPKGGTASIGKYGTLSECIERVISHGAYISFGRTSDGGATLIRVLDGADKLTTYCTTNFELLEAMEALNKRYPAIVLPLRVNEP